MITALPGGVAGLTRRSSAAPAAAVAGIQTQTAECIVLGEVATGDMVVALNKVDQLPGDKRERYVSRARKLVAQTLAATRFAGSPMVPTAAHPGAGADVGGDGAEAAAPLGVVEIVEALVAKARVRPGGGAGPFLFYIDHCFAIKGQGTVLTGEGGSLSQ